MNIDGWSKKIAVILLSVVLLGLLAGCGQSGGTVADSQGSQELVVYSSRNETFVDSLLQKFEEETGVNVQVLHAGDAVVNRISEERNNVQADVFISNDVGAMEFLRLEDLLEGNSPEGIKSIHSNYRADDLSWFALSARTRVLIYNADLISEEEMPARIEELADPVWKNRFAITRGGNGGMIGHVSALRYEWGDEATQEWLTAVKDNAGAIMQGHGDIRRAVGAGEFEFGLVNNYYYHQQLREPENNNVGVVYPDQGESDMGAVINAAGIAFIKNGPNQENTRLFADWILKPENQSEFSFASLEVPINPEIEAVSEALPISAYKVHGMPLKERGDVWMDSRQLIEASGFDMELR